MGGGGRVDDQRLHVRHVGQQGKNLQIVDKLVGRSLPALDFKGKDRRAAVGEILLIQDMVGMLRQAGVVDLLHLGMVDQILHHFFGVFSVAFYPKGQGLHSLEKQKGIEG